MLSSRRPGKLIEYLFLRLFLALVLLIPFGLRARLCERLGLLLHRMSAPYRRRVLENLHYAFPDSTPEWRSDVARRNFRILGRQLAEFTQTPRIDDSFFDKWFIAEPDAATHRRIYESGGIVILGHFGNWEWHGYFAGRLAGRNIYTLVKRHANWWANRYIEKSRQSSFMQLIYIDQNPFITINKLRKGELVAFTSDQNAGGRGVHFPFFGRLASTFLGPASVARNTNVPVWFVWSYHDDVGRIHFEAEELPRPPDQPRGDASKEEIESWERAFTYQWVRKLEEKVREHPADYLWTHSRWKHQPDNPDQVWSLFPEKPVILGKDQS